jgi:phosphatidylglycerophosphate synthase
LSWQETEVLNPKSKTLFEFPIRFPKTLLAILAGITDYLDGYIARRTGQITRLGEILDQFFWVMTIHRFLAAAGMNIPSSWAGKFKINLIMWGFLPSFIFIGGLVPSCEPMIGHVGRITVGLGIVANYLSVWRYTRVFMAVYDEATSKLD